MNAQVTLDLHGAAGARPQARKQRPPRARPTRPASNRARAGANQRGKPLTMQYPRAIERPVDDVLLLRAQRFGLHPIAARVMASRGLPSDVDVEAFLNPSLRNLDSPNRLADIGLAAHRSGGGRHGPGAYWHPDRLRHRRARRARRVPDGTARWLRAPVRPPGQFRGPSPE